MLKNFRTYNFAVNFYRQASFLKLPSHLRNQLDRAASSIVLNLAEGSGRMAIKDKRHFFVIAMGSLRECQAILSLCLNDIQELVSLADSLGAHLYRLIEHYNQ